METPQATYSGDSMRSVIDVGALRKYLIACIWAKVCQVVMVRGKNCDFPSHSTAQAVAEPTSSASYQESAILSHQSQNQGSTCAARYSSNLLSSVMNGYLLNKLLIACVDAKARTCNE